MVWDSNRGTHKHPNRFHFRGSYRNLNLQAKPPSADSRTPVSNTLPETNSKFAPENGWLEYYFPIGEAYFQGLC